MLTEEEKIIAKQLKAEGFNTSDITAHLGAKRIGTTSSVDARRLQDFKKKIEPNAFQRTVSDIPSDVKEGFTNMTESITRGMETAQDVRTRVGNLETTPLEGTLQTTGAGLRAGAEIVGNALLVAGKSFLPDEMEKAIASSLGTAVDKVASTRPVQEIKAQYDSLSPEQKRNVQGTLGIVEGVTTALGFGPVLNKLRGTLSEAATQALTKSDEILASSRARNMVPSIEVPNVKGLLSDLRLKLSDVDPQVETVLQRSNADEVNRYFQQARNAKTDVEKPTPLELAGTKAEEAFDAIDTARKDAIQGKKAILESVATERVPGNTLNDVMSQGIQTMQEKYGVKISSRGDVSQAPGRISTLDSADQKLVSEYFGRLNSLGISPTLKQVDDFVDWAQSVLYKQSKTMSKYEVASDPVVRSLQGVTGDLNSRLKSAVGNGYGEVNARVQSLLNLQDELSGALGADARKGGGLMKKLFSPTGGDTRRIFDEIRDETGIDLFKEATLAKFAMESVGDVRQSSLLKTLDVAIKEGAELDLTKPMSIYNWLRERADLDGQDLANALLRKINDEKQKP